MARGLEHDRLMRVSHSYVAATARDDGHEQQILAIRLMQHPATYTEWENGHSQLMQRVCQPNGLRAQIVRMRSTTLALIHRRAVFEYMRDRRLTGSRRHDYIALFYGTRDLRQLSDRRTRALLAQLGERLLLAFHWRPAAA